MDWNVCELRYSVYSTVSDLFSSVRQGLSTSLPIDSCWLCCWIEARWIGAARCCARNAENNTPCLCFESNAFRRRADAIGTQSSHPARFEGCRGGLGALASLRDGVTCCQELGPPARLDTSTSALAGWMHLYGFQNHRMLGERGFLGRDSLSWRTCLMQNPLAAGFRFWGCSTYTSISRWRSVGCNRAMQAAACRCRRRPTRHVFGILFRLQPDGAVGYACKHLFGRCRDSNACGQVCVPITGGLAPVVILGRHQVQRLEACNGVHV